MQSLHDMLITSELLHETSEKLTFSTDGRIEVENLVFPDNVTSVGRNAYYYNAKLKQVTFHDAITSISNNAFDSCRSLTTINFSNSIKQINSQAFQSCTSLESLSINIPDCTI